MSKKDSFDLSVSSSTTSSSRFRRRLKGDDNQPKSEILSPRIIDSKGNDITPRPLKHRDCRKHRPIQKYVMGNIRSSIIGVDSIVCDPLSNDLEVLEVSDFHEDFEDSTKILVDIEEPKSIPSSLHTRGFIELTETDTFFVDIPQVSFVESDKDYEKVKRRNLEYERYLERRGVECCVDAMTQTYSVTKSKAQQTEPIVSHERETLASEAIIFDESTVFLSQETKEMPVEMISLLRKEPPIKQIDLKPFSIVSVSSGFSETSSTSCSSTPDSGGYVPKESFLKILALMERAINSITYKDTIGAFYAMMHPHTNLVEEEKSNGTQEREVSLERLISLSSDSACDYDVTCLSWNVQNTNILAVGYAHRESPIKSKGFIHCWCVKNFSVPERIFEVPYGVKCVEFCNATPYLLAVGMYEGGIAIFDVRRTKSKPMLHNFGSSVRPIEIIWDMCWSYREDASQSVIISVSDDGHVLQWMMGNILEGTVLMHLRRSPERYELKLSNFVSQYARGYSVKCNPFNSEEYIVSTDEGKIYKGSTLHFDRQLAAYEHHYGPVYSVCWSPFSCNTFLSCGNDGSIAVWLEENTKPMEILKPDEDLRAIFDLSWSFTSSTTFATVSDNAIEVWDLAINIRKPLIKGKSGYNEYFTCVHFCPNGDLLAVGIRNKVTFYAIKNMPRSEGKELHDIIASKMNVTK